MKLLLAVLALLPTLASAEPAFWCHAEGSELSVNFGSPPTTASLQNGTSTLANMACRYSDNRDAYLVCEQNGSEYSVALSNKNGGISAYVFQNGAKIATLGCGRN